MKCAKESACVDASRQNKKKKFVKSRETVSIRGFNGDRVEHTPPPSSLGVSRLRISKMRQKLPALRRLVLQEARDTHTRLELAFVICSIRIRAKKKTNKRRASIAQFTRSCLKANTSRFTSLPFTRDIGVVSSLSRRSFAGLSPPS